MIDWLNSADGQDLVHAIIGVLVAISMYLTWRTGKNTRRRD